MRAGSHGERLRRVADRLRAELADPEAAELPGIGSTLGAREGMTRLLEPEDEALVACLRGALARIASTVGAGAGEPQVQAIKIALDGAEFVIRGELLGDRPERVLGLVPSFVFLVTLAAADHDRALELSRRAAELTERPAP